MLAGTYICIVLVMNQINCTYIPVVSRPHNVTAMCRTMWVNVMISLENWVCLWFQISYVKSPENYQLKTRFFLLMILLLKKRN
jgi:hypothetical protein